MPDLRSLSLDLAGGRVTRRQFVSGAVALGLSAPLAAALAAHPAAAIAAAQDATAAATGPVGPAVDKVIFSAFNQDQAPLDIQNNNMDLYLFGLKTAGANSLVDSPDVRLIQAPSSTLSLILNPAPAPAGDLNPFSIPALRKAMQFLVDRDFIANSIYQGRAVPMYSHVSPLDYDELTVFETVRSQNFRYDAEYARGEFEREMTAAGAARDGNGQWAISGRPIQLKMVTRVEDERRDIGDLVRTALEGVGFQVAPSYLQFGPATLAVYSSDPVTFNWHIYTEGWGRSSPDRYDFSSINQFTAPWQGNMPGWRETGFWQYEQADLDTLGQRLFRGEFASQDERDQIYQEMTRISLDESIRVWLVTALQSFPARVELQNVTEDLVGGPKSPFTLRNASIPGKTEIRVGHLWVYTERTTWNPVGGFGDVYSSDIYRNVVDASVLNHPFTGIPMAFRAEFEVESAGPGAKLDVPADAYLWDTAAKTWAAVGDGVQATSKVTYDFTKFFQSTYHHGAQITPADLIYTIAQGYEFAYDEERVQIETALGVTQRPYFETFRGISLLDDDRLEVYVDYWHFEPNYIASYANIGGLSTPWELLVAMDEVVFTDRQAAYTDTTASRFNVPWLSLVTESDARLVRRVLQEYIRAKTVPEGFFTLGERQLVTEEDAVARYQAAVDWFETTNMLVISNGPFFLSRYDAPAQFAELTAFREPNYPFTSADWNFGVPQRLALQVTPPVPTPAGTEIAVPVTVTGPGALSLRYVLVDPTTNTVIVTSDAAPGDAGAFNVVVDAATTGGLFPGFYQLYLLASSDAIAEVAEQRVDVEIAL